MARVSGIAAAADAALAGVSAPSDGVKVYKSECAFSFVTPEDADGLYVNLRTFVSVAKEFLDADCAGSGFPGGAGAYLHQRWTKSKPTKADGTEAAAAPLTKVAIGVPGGAAAEAVTWNRSHTLVMHPSGERLDLPSELPAPGLSDAVNAIIVRVIEHDDASKQVSRDRTCRTCAWQDGGHGLEFAFGLFHQQGLPWVAPGAYSAGGVSSWIVKTVAFCLCWSVLHRRK
jgi:hypothetical protein